uniref:Probable arginine--tRNA ligase, mitochondrial n=1 Tax=Acrobeloides nanus TaxID=290746 RepID=A0A914E1L9_9BILA
MGFMQCYLNRVLRSSDIFAELLSHKVATKKTVVLDFSSPNIAKQFHIGNLRSTILGNFIQNIYRRAGHNVISINYLGDWGTQMAFLALQWPETRRQMDLDSNKWNDMPSCEKIRLLTRSYIEANNRAKNEPEFRIKVLELFSHMETARINGETPTSNEQLALWKMFRDVSEDYLRVFYKNFMVNFDVWEGESDYILDAFNLSEELIHSGKAFKKDDLWAVKENGSRLYYVLRKSDNTSLYLSRDYGAFMSRNKRYNADNYLYIVDSAQSNHFEGLKSLLRVQGFPEHAEKIAHVPYGRIAGLSTREGKSEAKSPTLRITSNEIRDVAQQLSATSIIMNDFMKKRDSQYKFSFENAYKLTDYSPIAVQIKHTRLNSLVETHAELANKIFSGAVDLEELSMDPSPLANQLFDRISSLDNALFISYQGIEPNAFARYLMELSREVGQAFSQLRIHGEPEEVALPRLLLFLAAKRILYDGTGVIASIPASNLTCANITCNTNETCIMKEIMCGCVPCNPVPTCVPKPSILPCICTPCRCPLPIEPIAQSSNTENNAMICACPLCMIACPLESTNQIQDGTST